MASLTSGMIFTGIVSFLVFVSAFAAGLAIFRGKQKEDKLLSSYACFLLVTSGIWLFTGVRHFFGWLGMADLDKTFYLIDQIFVFISAPPLVYYVSLKLFHKEKLTKILAGLFSFTAFLGLFFIFTKGVNESGVTYFASKFEPNKVSFYIFLFSVIPPFAGVFFDCFMRIGRWLFRRQITESYEFFYSLVILIYLGLGVFDEQGLIVGWGLVVFRLTYVAVFLMAYLTFYFQSSEKERFMETQEKNAGV